MLLHNFAGFFMELDRHWTPPSVRPAADCTWRQKLRMGIWGNDSHKGVALGSEVISGN